MMKNTNPLFILFSTIFVLFIAIYSFNTTKERLKNEQKEYSEFKLLAVKYNTQKQFWSNKKQIINSIQKVLKSSNIRNAKIIQKKRKIIVQISSINTTMVQKFINKLLNKRYNIIKLDIYKNKITLEIGLVV